MVSRLHGHSSSSGAQRVWDEPDCVALFEQKLIDAGAIDADAVRAMKEEARKEANDAVVQATAEPKPTKEDVEQFTYAPSEVDAVYPRGLHRASRQAVVRVPVRLACRTGDAAAARLRPTRTGGRHVLRTPPVPDLRPRPAVAVPVGAAAVPRHRRGRPDRLPGDVRRPGAGQAVAVERTGRRAVQHLAGVEHRPRDRRRDLSTGDTTTHLGQPYGGGPRHPGRPSTGGSAPKGTLPKAADPDAFAQQLKPQIDAEMSRHAGSRAGTSSRRRPPRKLRRRQKRLTVLHPDGRIGHIELAPVFRQARSRAS